MAAKKVIILAPRLDCMFKKGVVPPTVGPTPPVRVPWENFVKHTYATHKARGDIVKIVVMPLWQFSPETVAMYDADLTYVPHKEEHNFSCPNHKVLYYMQMVFPHLFMVDPRGWCAGASNWPIRAEGNPKSERVRQIRQRAWNNQSKFDQPKAKSTDQFPPNFIFFPCQIPHDETIKYHSTVTVEKALAVTCEFSAKNNIPLVVKGHPVNPGSMLPLHQMVSNKHNVTWVEDVSVHDLLRRCDAVFTVNSGCGMEALLHNKPVFTFGNADYSAVSIDVKTVKGIEKAWDTKDHMVSFYNAFLDSYLETCFDTTNKADFEKLPSDDS